MSGPCLAEQHSSVRALLIAHLLARGAIALLDAPVEAA